MARSRYRVLGHGQKLDRTPAFANGVFLAPQRRINHSEHAEVRRVVGLVTHRGLRFHARRCKGGARCRRVAPSARSQTFKPSARKTFSRPGSQSTGFHGDQGAVGSDGVMLAQGEIEPLVREFRGRRWLFGDDGLDGYVQRLRVRPPCEIDGGSLHPHFSLVILIGSLVLGHQLEHAVQEGGRFSKTTLEFIDLRECFGGKPSGADRAPWLFQSCAPTRSSGPGGDR